MNRIVQDLQDIDRVVVGFLTGARISSWSCLCVDGTLRHTVNPVRSSSEMDGTLGI